MTHQLNCNQKPFHFIELRTNSNPQPLYVISFSRNLSPKNPLDITLFSIFLSSIPSHQWSSDGKETEGMKKENSRIRADVQRSSTHSFAYSLTYTKHTKFTESLSDYRNANFKTQGLRELLDSKSLSDRTIKRTHGTTTQGNSHTGVL